MAKDWIELTNMTGNSPLVVEKVRLTDRDISIEGDFELPPLAQLSAEDQVFVMAFIRSDGSIKDMEKTFGISYPTVKNRLARIGQQFKFIETVPASEEPEKSEKDKIMAQLERGEITAAEAIERLEK
jgi:hypothetical protein